MTDAATVRVYCYDRKRSFTMPAAELAAGMVRTAMEGVDGEVWVDAGDLRPGPVRCRKLPPAVRASAESAYAVLGEVLNAGGTDLAGFLDGFRRDADPVAEARTWDYLAWVYGRVVGLGAFTLAGRCGVFNTLLACSMSPDGPTPGLRRVLDAKTLTLPQREAVIDLYYLGTAAMRRRAA